MSMEVSQTNKDELAVQLEAYLIGKIDHESIRSYAWGLSDSSPREPSGSEQIDVLLCALFAQSLHSYFASKDVLASR